MAGLNKRSNVPLAGQKKAPPQETPSLFQALMQKVQQTGANLQKKRDAYHSTWDEIMKRGRP